MTGQSDFHVVFGTGPLGTAVARELVRRGRRVRVVNHSGRAPKGAPGEVEMVAADAYDPRSTCRVSAGAAVVYQCAQPPYREWLEKFPALQASILEGAAASGAKLVAGDNLYMYGEVDGPIHEDLPYAAKTCKGSLRARMAETLLEAHARGRARVTIGRGSDFFGPGVTGSLVGEQVFGSLVNGKAASALGNPDLPHTYTFIDDFGRGLVELGEQDAALGKAWHVPNAETVTTRQFIAMIGEELGREPKMMAAGPLLMRLLGLFIPEVRELIELRYQVTRPYLVDDSRYKAAFGDHATPLREAIRQTLAWYRTR